VGVVCIDFLFKLICIKMTSINIFAVLSTSTTDSSDIPIQKGFQKGKKKVDKKKCPPKVRSTDAILKDEMSIFESRYPIGVILFHHNGKDRFNIFDFKFSHNFYIELSAREVKKITFPIIEEIINTKASRPGNVVVWESYFEKVSLEKLDGQKCYEVPKFNATFDLIRVRDRPISNLTYSPAIIFDFRSTNSREEFIYLSNGERVHFGKAFDDFRVKKNRDKLESIREHYERSLHHFKLSQLEDTRDKIFRLTAGNSSYADDRNYANEAIEFIARYVHLSNEDTQAELRNLLPFHSWVDDLKKEYEKALEYRNNLRDLYKVVKEEVAKSQELRDKSRELQDEEAYPSL